MHEMLHVVLFYYNKNLNKSVENPGMANAKASAQKKIDWYVEGLARYFETFAGAKHDFFSQGFKQTLPDKIRFSRGGSNYFMRYPDQAFVDLRYENALFWRFIDHNYGMSAIESLSRSLREVDTDGFKQALEKTSGLSFNELLKKFALAVLLKDFGLKDDEPYLKNIAMTHLVYRNGDFYGKDGYGNEKYMGPICQSDWIGAWEKAKARFGEFSVAGDNTDQSDVSGLATDFYRIDLDPSNSGLPWIGVALRSQGPPLGIQAVIRTRGGAILTWDFKSSSLNANEGLNLEKLLNEGKLKRSEVKTIYLLITNTDNNQTATYEIISR